MRRLELDVLPSALVEGRTEGFAGQDCLQIRRNLLAPLGEVTAERLTREFYDQPATPLPRQGSLPIVVGPSGAVRSIYAESFNWDAFGSPVIERASHVEPSRSNQWFADMSPVGGPQLGPFTCRSEAILGELQWLQANWMLGDE